MVQAESTLLSYLIFNPNFYLLRAGEIVEGIFTTDENKSVFRAIKALIERGGNVNTLTVSNEMGESESFHTVTRILQEHIYSDIEDIIDFLVNQHKEQTLQIVLMDALSRAKNNGWNDAVNYITQEIIKLNESAVKDLSPIKEDLKELLSHIERNLTKTGLTGIGTGITKFDNFSGGLQRSDLVILAGRTSMGKTSLALGIGRNASVDFKVPTVIYSLEMSNIQLSARTASMESGISSKEILNSKLETYQIDAIRSSIENVYESKLFIAKTSNKITTILSSMMSYILKEKAELFIVDYLQLVTLGQKGVSREQEVGTISRMFKNFAKENNVCVMALSQLSRGHQTSTSVPQLSDLRDSGQIEEAADVVMFIHRPEYYKVETFDDGLPTHGKAEIVIAKGRNVGLAMFRLNFIASLTKFTDEEEINYSAIQPSNEF